MPDRHGPMRAIVEESSVAFEEIPTDVRDRVTEAILDLDAAWPKRYLDGGPGDAPIEEPAEEPASLALPLGETTAWVAEAEEAPVSEATDAMGSAPDFENTWLPNPSFGAPAPWQSDAFYPLESVPVSPRSCWEATAASGLYFGGRPGFRALSRESYPFDVADAPRAVSEFYPLRAFTVAEIAQIGVGVRKPSAELTAADVSLNVYTVPGDSEGEGDGGAPWYGSRLQALPAEANVGEPTVPAETFADFSTGTEASNRLRFFDRGRSDLDGGTGAIPKPDPENQATLADLGSGPVSWPTTEADRDYSDETVLGLSIQVDADSLETPTYVDNVGLRLITGELLVLDLGATPDR